MAIKIQELIIQTKVKASNNNIEDNNTPFSKLNYKQELKKLEKRLQYNYLEATKRLLREQQER